eukprot:s4138_g3.t1
MTSKPKINEMAMTATTTATTPEMTGGGSDSADIGKPGGDVSDGGQKDRINEVLEEATQLIRTMRLQPSYPKMKVMQLEGLDQATSDFVLLDSGAKHGLRPARDLGEWESVIPTNVQLASGSTDEFRIKQGTKILLGHPTTSTARILLMGALNDLDFTLEWKGGQCRLYDVEGREIPVVLQNGCPMLEGL